MSSKLSRYISIHIPKTGGTWFYRRLLKVSTRSMPDYEDDDPFVADRHKYKKTKYRQFDVIHGHFTVSKYAHLNWPYIVWLRDPVDRMISQYDYSHRNKRWICAGLAQQRTVLEFAKAGKNMMAFYLQDKPLAKFAFVGVLELFVESMELFGELTGLDVRRFVSTKYQDEVRRTYSAERTELSDKERAWVKSINGEDYELYNEALKIYGG